MRHIQDLTSDDKIVIAGVGLHHEHVSLNKKDFLKKKKENSASSPFSPLMSVFTPTALNFDEHFHLFPRLDVVSKKFIWCLSLAKDRFLVGPPPTKMFSFLFSGGRSGPGFDSGSVLQIVVVGQFATVVQLRCRSLCCGKLELLQRRTGTLEFRCLARNFFIVSDFTPIGDSFRGWQRCQVVFVTGRG